MTFTGLDEVVSGTLSFKVDGVFSDIAGAYNSYNGGFANLAIISSGGFSFDRIDIAAATNCNTISSFFDACTSGGYFEHTVHIPFEIATGQSRILDFLLTTGAFAGGTANFLSTGQFTMTLEEGASFTSETGLFLTAAVVPLPATSLLMLSALGLLCGLPLMKRHCSLTG